MENSRKEKFLSLWSKLSDLLIVNLVFCLTCLPLFTIPTAITALDSVCLKSILDDDNYLVKVYLVSFKKNFKQSTIIGIIMVGVGFILINHLIIANAFSVELKNYFQIISSVLLIMLGLISLYIFPYIARYQVTIRKAFATSFSLVLKHFNYTILLLLLYITVAVGMYILMSGKYFIYILLACIFSLTAYFKNLIISKVFLKYHL